MILLFLPVLDPTRFFVIKQPGSVTAQGFQAEIGYEEIEKRFNDGDVMLRGKSSYIPFLPHPAICRFIRWVPGGCAPAGRLHRYPEHTGLKHYI